MTHTRNHLTRPRLTTTALALAAALAAPHALADTQDELKMLKAQIEALQKSLANLEQKQARIETQVAPANAVTAGATKGSFKLPGSDTSVKFGGYVKVDAIYSSRSAGANSQADLVLVPGQIPVGNAAANEKGQFKLHARQTRLNVGTHTPTSWGDLTTYVEVDFFGADGNEVISNSNNLRARHAFASFGGLTVGQTWSTFMDPASLPETLDFGGPVGETFVRQGLVRWNQKFDGGGWTVALENPESYLSRRNSNGTYTTLLPDDDRVPDIVAKLDFNTRVGRFAVAGMARNIRVDTAAINATAVAADDDVWGGALALYGSIPTVGKDTFNILLTGGNALGRYMGQAVFTDASIDANGKIDLNPQWGTILSYRHYWSETLRSTLALSAAESNNPSTAGSMNKSSRTAHLNLLWSPVPAATLGVEFIHGSLEKESGLKGTLNRLQASAQYAF